MKGNEEMPNKAKSHGGARASPTSMEESTWQSPGQGAGRRYTQGGAARPTPTPLTSDSLDCLARASLRWASSTSLASEGHTETTGQAPASRHSILAKETDEETDNLPSRRPHLGAGGLTQE